MAPSPQFAPVRQEGWRLALRLGIWTLLVLVLTGIVAGFAREELRTVALNRARDSYRKDLVYRLWATLRGGVYVPLDEKTPPNPYLAHLPDREIQGSNGKTYTLVNPAYMTRMVHELGRDGYGLKGHLTSLKPLRPENAPDPWEQKVLESFERGVEEAWEEVGEGSQHFLRYMGAFKVQEGCLRCHAHQGYRVGDVRGGISVSVPMDGGAFFAPGREGRWHFGMLGLFWVIGCGAILVLFLRERRFAREKQLSLAALMESRELYQSLVDDLPLPLYRTDREGRIRFANVAFLAELDRDLAAVEGQSLCSLLPHDLAVLHREENAQVLKGDRVRRTEARPGATGDRWVEVLKLPVRSATGEVLGIQGMTWDISDRVASEQRLRAAADQHQALVETTRDGYLLVDAEGRIQEANDVLLRWLDLPREEVVGVPVWAFDVGHGEEEVRQHLQAIQARGWDRFETRFRRSDGSTFEVEASISLLKGQEGRTLGFLRDVGEEKASLQRLAESEQRFRTLLESLPVPVFLQRAQQMIYCNQAGARLLGASDASMLQGRDVLDFVHPDQRAWIRERTRVALETMRTAPRAEHTLLTLDGRPFPAEVEGIPVVLWGEAAIVVFAEDLTQRRAEETERRRMEEEIQHAQRLESLGHLAGGVAHDMNNVLAAILGLGSTLRVRAGEDLAMAKAMDIIVHAAERGRELVKGLTDFARKGLKETRPVDLNEVVRSEGALLHRTTLQRVEVVLDLEEPLPLVMGDPHALGNALMNLCVNALDAMPEGGTLRITTRALEGGQVELEVSDSGEGMPPEVVAHALEPFFTTKPVGKGTGLGLSVVYGTVKSHGGRLELMSVPGVGTRIVLRFPALSGEGAASDAAPQETSPERPLHILLVDDDELVRGTVPEMLGTLGHAVETAEGGAEALERLRKGLRVDLVILDLNMPGMNGTETLRQLRELLPELPVLIASGHKDVRVDAILASTPRVSVLMKPYTLRECRDALRKAGV